MLFATTLLPIIFAGLMNGSFVIPTRYTKNFINEQLWFYHSLLGVAVIPWLIMLIFFPPVFSIYSSLNEFILLFIILSGLVFGLGQLCFAYAIDYLGVALSFTINLGIGVTLGSMFVVFYTGKFLSVSGFSVTLAVLLILSGLIISYYFGKNREVNPNDIRQKTTSRYGAGWALASLAGVCSGFQNITFILVLSHTAKFSAGIDPFWVWPPFLSAAAIAMLLGFATRIKKMKGAFDFNLKDFLFSRNIFLILLMGIFFTGSLALYSSGMGRLSHTQQIIGWPAFMVIIILTSQFWGLIYNESSMNNGGNKTKIYRVGGALLLIIAILLLAIEI